MSGQPGGLYTSEYRRVLWGESEAGLKGEEQGKWKRS